MRALSEEELTSGYRSQPKGDPTMARSNAKWQGSDALYRRMTKALAQRRDGITRYADLIDCLNEENVQTHRAIPEWLIWCREYDVGMLCVIATACADEARTLRHALRDFARSRDCLMHEAAERFGTHDPHDDGDE